MEPQEAAKEMKAPLAYVAKTMKVSVSNMPAKLQDKLSTVASSSSSSAGDTPAGAASGSSSASAKAKATTGDEGGKKEARENYKTTGSRLSAKVLVTPVVSQHPLGHSSSHVVCKLTFTRACDSSADGCLLTSDCFWSVKN